MPPRRSARLQALRLQQVDKHGQGDGEDQPQAAATEQQAAATEAATDGAGQEPAAKDVTDSEDEYYGHGSERSYPGDSEVDMSIQQNRIVNEEYDSDLESDEYEGNDYMVFMGNEFGFLAGMYDDDDDFEDPYEYDEAFDDYDVDEEEDQDEDEEEDQDEDGPGGNIDPAFLFGHLSRSVYARLVQSLPLLEDFVPTPLDHELAVELSLRTLPLAPNGEFPHLRGTTEDVKILSPTLALAARELDSGRVGVPPKHATINAATFHRLPSRVQKVMDRMQSRAYIGRFTDDGSIFVAAYQNERTIRLYDTHTNDSEPWRLSKDIHARNLRWTVTDIAMSSDQRFLLYASINPVVHMVDVRSSDSTRSVANVTDIHEALQFSQTSDTVGIWSLQWSADDKEIIAGTSDASLYIYDVAAGRTVVRVEGHGDDVNAVAYAGKAYEGSENVIFTGSDDREIKVWDRRTLGERRGKAVGVFVGHTEGIAHIDAKGDGRYLISNSKDQTIKLWDLRRMLTQKEADIIKRDCGREIPSFHWDYRWMDYPARGRVVTHPRDVSIASYRGHSVLHTLCRAYWSPEHTTGQRYIYAASADGSVVIYDVISCQQVGRLESWQTPAEIIRDCSWHPYEPLIATASFDGSIVTWEPDDDKFDGLPELISDPPTPKRRSAGMGGTDND